MQTGERQERTGGWLALNLAGLVVVTLLMYPLAQALGVLGRMLVEGDVEAEPHPVVTLVLFGIFAAAVLLMGGRSIWDQWRQRESITDPTTGRTLSIHRGSPEHEVQRFRYLADAEERRAAREREVARRRAELAGTRTPRDGAGAADDGAGAAVGAAAEEARRSVDDGGRREAAERRDMSHLGAPMTVLPVGPARERVHRLRRAAWWCVVLWLPVSLGLALLSEQLGGAREWGLLAFLLLPLAWILGLMSELVAHRRMRSAATRASLALYLAIICLAVGLVSALCLFVAVAERGATMAVVGPISAALLLGCWWLGRRELRYVRTDGPRDPGPSMADLSDL